MHLIMALNTMILDPIIKKLIFSILQTLSIGGALSNTSLISIIFRFFFLILGVN